MRTILLLRVLVVLVHQILRTNGVKKILQPRTEKLASLASEASKDYECSGSWTAHDNNYQMALLQTYVNR